MLLNGCSRFDRETRGKRIEIGIRIDLGGIKIEFFAPDQLRRLSLFDDGLKETLKHLPARAQADFAERGMIRERLIQIIVG
jgi:hypothetical protein